MNALIDLTTSIKEYGLAEHILW